MGFVSFSDFAVPPYVKGKYECLSNELAFATPTAKKALTDFITTLDTKDGTKYLPALIAAFRILDGSHVIKEETGNRGMCLVHNIHSYNNHFSVALVN